MKAIFVQRDCLLRGSGYDPESVPQEIALSDEVLAGLRDLGAIGLFIIPIGSDTIMRAGEAEAVPDTGIMRALAQLMPEGEGAADALLICTHAGEEECACWGPHPGYLYRAASAMDAHLNESYVISDSVLDVSMAYAGGCRPILVLSGRSIGETLGDQPKHKDMPIAIDLGTAARYVREEEEITEQLGEPRPAAAPTIDFEFLETATSLPELMPLSARAQALCAKLRRPRLQPREMLRWLGPFIAGGIGLSLGIAYLLTHLYRQQQFPAWVWYATLQFIPRQVRGLLFILVSMTVLAITLWSIYRAVASNGGLSKRWLARR